MWKLSVKLLLYANEVGSNEYVKLDRKRIWNFQGESCRQKKQILKKKNWKMFPSGEEKFMKLLKL